MPRVPDASSVTRLRALQSSAVTDPAKRSASYVPAQPTLLYSLRSSDAGRGMFPAGSYLSTPIARGYVNSRHRGFLTGPPPPLPLIQIPISGTDFSDLSSFSYDFEAVLPPGPDFDVIFVVGTSPPTNVQDLTSINIRNTDDPQSTLFGSTTISTTPTWPGATFTSSATSPTLSADAGTYPGMPTVIQFRAVPVITNIRIRFFGGAI
jgi:hypothetical protein